jgi:hypothetical protein
MPINVTDTIHIHSLHTGSTVGNGGSGTFNGDIINTPNITFNPSNTVTGSTNTLDDPHHVHVDANTHAGDQTNSISQIDQSQYVMVGLGGSGGSGNVIMDSGNLNFDLNPHIHV